MSTFYLDYDLGNDSTTATPLGWWSVAYTGGTGNAPIAGDIGTGAISGSTAKATIVTVSSGTWTTNDAAGTMYFYGKSAAFQAEQIDFPDGHMDIAADLTYCAWKTITSGATAARIAPGDIIRIAKSPAPVSLGTTGAWTNLSKTVTLGAAQTANIDLCETEWTGAGNTTVTRTAVATDGKEGSYCMKLAVDASPQANILQAYYATGELNLSAYQKISFWIKNEAAIANATTWVVNLCSDVAGATPVDSFVIPAIPSTARWLPLTLTKDGGGNLGASIKSIAIYTGATAPTASKYIYVDDFIACTTAGLNLQSLISKNSAEQGGTEGWYGIQSINGTTVLLDNDTNTKGNAGRGYSGTTETVTTYKRETIKTALAAAFTTQVQAIQDSGTLAEGNIQFQGGWNTTTTVQEGETFFDGLNGNGYGIYLTGKSYTTLNYLNVCRYNNGVYYNTSNNNTITTLSNANNNSSYGVYYIGAGNNNTITTLSNANNNSSYGVYYNTSSNNTITTLSNANNNSFGVYYNTSNNNTITTLSNANNNSSYGVYYYNTSNNTITTLSNANNNSYGVYYNTSNNNTITTLSNANNNSYGVYYNTSNNNTITTLSNANNNSFYGVCYNTSNNNTITTLSNANNNSYGVYYYTSSNNTITTLSNANNNSYGVYYNFSGNNTIKSLSTTGNASAGIYFSDGINYIFNALIAEATEVGGYTSFANSRLFSNKHDQTPNNHWIFTDGGTINSLATTREGGTGIMWKLAITSSNRSSSYPLTLSIAKIAVSANNLVTVKAYLKKDHATNIVGKLVCRGGQIAGIASDLVATKANDTNWEELTISGTPTAAGVIEIECWAEYSAGNSNIYVEDLTISQA